MAKRTKLRVIFMGTSRFAARILNAMLRTDHNIISIYTQDTQKEVWEIARAKGIKTSNPKKFDAQILDELKSLKPDLLVVASYGKILPKVVLEIPRFGALNVHPSFLPKFRGPSPLQNAILAGVSEIGTTIMLMNEKVDSGEILAQVKIPIGTKVTYPEILEKSAKISSDLLLKTIPLWVEKKIQPKAQNENQATYCQLIERSDGKINWSDSAKEIYDRWRALTPWPGIYAFSKIKSRDMRLKLIAIDYDASLNNNAKKMGEVFSFNDEICVQTGKGLIILKTVQPESKSVLPIHSFLNGYKKFLGSILK